MSPAIFPIPKGSIAFENILDMFPIPPKAFFAVSRGFVSMSPRPAKTPEKAEDKLGNAPFPSATILVIFFGTTISPS